MFGISQFVGYPAYIVEVELSNSTVLAFWLASFQIPDSSAPGEGLTYPVYTGNGPTGVFSADVEWDTGLAAFDGDAGASVGVATASLLASVAAWVRGYDWSTVFGAGSGVTLTNVKITKYREASDDVTPSA